MQGRQKMEKVVILADALKIHHTPSIRESVNWAIKNVSNFFRWKCSTGLYSFYRFPQINHIPNFKVSIIFAEFKLFFITFYSLVERCFTLQVVMLTPTTTLRFIDLWLRNKLWNFLHGFAF